MSSDRQRLVMRSGPTPGKVYELTKDSVTIGREASADIVIPDPEVSRSHARLTSKQGTYMLEDLGSTNGTFVNKQRITGQRMLNPGDEVTLGESVVLSFEGPGVGATVAVSAAKVPAEAAAATAAEPTPAPPEEEAAPAKKSNTRRNILIGCGCLVVLVVVIVVVVLSYTQSCNWFRIGC